MAYAILRIDKVKGFRDMSDRYRHNFREFDVANADPDKQDENMEPVDLMGKTYMQAYEEELLRLKMEGVRSKKVRKDAVQGYEVMLTYSHDKENVPIEEWVQKNVEWLQQAFNPPENRISFSDEDGNKREIKSDNVKSVVVHMDEVNPHIHAFVVPIDESGHLNSYYYVNGRNSLAQMQNQYAKAMSEFGLKRGKERTATSHHAISRYYEGLRDAATAELPDVIPGETADEYKARADEVYRNQQIQARNALQRTEKALADARAETMSRVSEIGERHSKEGEKILKLASDLHLDEATPERLRETRIVLEQHQDFEEAKKSFPDKEKVYQVEQDYAMIAEWNRRRKHRESERAHERDDLDQR